MIADAVHSFTDVISDVVTLWALHMSTLPHDSQYPYGEVARICVLYALKFPLFYQAEGSLKQ